MRTSYSRRRLNDSSCEQKYIEIVVINGPCLLDWFDREGHVLPFRRNNSHMHTLHPPIHKHSAPTDLKQYENRGETVEHITALVRARLRMVVQCWCCDVVCRGRACVLGAHCLHDTRPSRICDPLFPQRLMLSRSVAPQLYHLHQLSHETIPPLHVIFILR